MNLATTISTFLLRQRNLAAVNAKTAVILCLAWVACSSWCLARLLCSTQALAHAQRSPGTPHRWAHTGVRCPSYPPPSSLPAPGVPGEASSLVHWCAPANFISSRRSSSGRGYNLAHHACISWSPQQLGTLLVMSNQRCWPTSKWKKFVWRDYRQLCRHACAFLHDFTELCQTTGWHNTKIQVLYLGAHDVTNASRRTSTHLRLCRCPPQRQRCVKLDRGEQQEAHDSLSLSCSSLFPFFSFWHDCRYNCHT